MVRYGQGKDFFAFISYKREDEKWAKWLQDKLEHYKFPTNLNGRRDLPKHIRPTFRDVTDMTPGLLEEKINSALQNSEWLIVICSPRSAKSSWVCKEAQTFIDLERTDHIIPFVIEGSPFSGDEKTECYPEALLNLTGSSELLATNINEMGRDAAAVKVVARMFDLKFDALWKRWEREQRRKRWIIILSVLLFALVSLGVGARIAQQNVELKKAYKDLSDANKKTRKERERADREWKRAETANESLVIKNKELKEKNESIASQNSLIAQQKTDLAKTNVDLQQSNKQLIIEKDNVVRKNRQMHINQARYIAEKCNELIDNGDSYLARRLIMEVLPTKDHPDYPYTIEAENVLRAAMLENSFFLRGHTDSINCVKFSNDGSFIATGSCDKTIRIWDTENGMCVKTLNNQTSAVESLGFSSDGVLLAASDGKKIKIFDTTSWNNIQNLVIHDNNVIYVDFFIDNNFILSSSSSEIKILNPMQNVCLHTIDCEGDSIISCVLSLSGKYFAASFRSGTIKVWDSKTYNCIQILKTDNDYINGIAFTSDEKGIICVKMCGDIEMWNWQKAETIFSTNPGKNLGSRFHTHLVASSPNGTFATASTDMILRFWSTESENAYGSVPFGDRINSIAYNIDGTMFASALNDHTIRVIDIREDKSSMKIDINESESVISPCKNCSFFAYSNGLYIDIRDTDELGYISSVFNQIGRNHFLPLDFSGDNRFLLCQTSNNTINIWNLNKKCWDDRGIVLSEINEPDCITNARISPNGEFIVVAYGTTIWIYSMITKKCVKIPTGHIESISSISFSNSGKWFISTSLDNTIRVWDTCTKKCIQILGSPIKNIQVDPIIRMFRPFQESNKYPGYNDAVFTQDDKKIIAVSNDNLIYVWDWSNNAIIKTISGHTECISSVNCCQTNDLVVTTSDDNTIKIWNLNTGNCLQTFVGNGEWPFCAFFNSQGNKIISSSHNGDIQIWEFPLLKDLIDSTHNRFKNFPLSKGEREKYYLE